MDLEQNLGREAGPGRDVAFEKNAKGILVGESFERTSVAARMIEERDVKEHRTETNEISRAHNEVAPDRKLGLTGNGSNL